VDYAVSVGMLIVLMLLYHVSPTWGLLLLPLWTAVLLMLSLGIGLFAAALTVSYRDVQYVLPVITNILMWASPVAYSISQATGKLLLAYNLNPLTGVMEAIRWSVLGTKLPPLWTLSYSACVSAAALWIGAVAFKQMERQFADII
jgi:lipopolysaccharide transport system permease protein